MGASPRGESQGGEAGPSKASDGSSGGRPDDGTGFTCPICLLECRELSMKTVTLPCHHNFCLGCLLKWADIKRNCPVCKCVLEGYIFDIQSDTRFQQYSFPAENKPDEGVEVTFIDTFDAQQGRNLPPGRFLRPCTYSRTFIDRVPCVTSEAFRSLDKMRDPSLRKRVAVYAKGLLASSAGVDRPSRYRPDTPEEKKRLEGWIHREFKALLGVKDAKMLVSFVMSVVHKYGFAAVKSDKPPQYTRSKVQPARQRVIVFDPISALEPLLQSRAAAFWHELKAFAVSRLDVRTYDQVVQYSGDLMGSEDSDPSVQPNNSKRPQRRESSTDIAQSRPWAGNDVGWCGDARAATSQCDTPLFSTYRKAKIEGSRLDGEHLAMEDEAKQGEERQHAAPGYSGPGSRSRKLLGKRRHPNEVFEVGEWRPFRKGLQGGPGAELKRGRGHGNESLRKRARTMIRNAGKGLHHGAYGTKSPKWTPEGPSHKGIHHGTYDMKSPRWGPDGPSRSKGLPDRLFQPKSPTWMPDSPSRLGLGGSSAGVTSGWRERESPESAACSDVENTQTRAVPRAKFGDSQEDSNERPGRAPRSPESPFGRW